MRNFALLTMALAASAHMNIFHPSMYGWQELMTGKLNAGDWASPMLNLPFDKWWLRGYKNKPTGGEIMELPAGGKVTIQHACNLAWTSYAPLAGGKNTTTVPGSRFDACPDSPGAYHASRDPAHPSIDPAVVSGCALAIADVDHPDKLTQDNQVIFSINKKCITQKLTSYDIPAAMPACTGKKCVCVWYWLANEGTANYYMSGFDCKITQVSQSAKRIAPPNTPYFIGSPITDPIPNFPINHALNKTTRGAKSPIFVYNNGILPSRAQPWVHNLARAGYNKYWSFDNDGAQNDIFLDQPIAQIPATTAPAVSVEPTTRVAVQVFSSTMKQSTPVISSSTRMTISRRPPTASSTVLELRSETVQSSSASSSRSGSGFITKSVHLLVSSLNIVQPQSIATSTKSPSSAPSPDPPVRSIVQGSMSSDQAIAQAHFESIREQLQQLQGLFSRLNLNFVVPLKK